jgi:hypothetical protein
MDTVLYLVNVVLLTPAQIMGSNVASYRICCTMGVAFGPYWCCTPKEMCSSDWHLSVAAVEKVVASMV